tara:strand:+ start:6324 stop:6782 length:459 start_codon:yes stop_codon:yes gene_type:complete
MKLIAHRGNIDGPNPSDENNPTHIDKVIKMGYDLEVDLWHKENNYYLGHDEPQYHVPMSWLVKHKDVLWIHCKNIEALKRISSSLIDFNYFWHQTDDFTLTSKKYIWTYPGKQYTLNSVVVMPEWNTDLDQFSNILNYKCFGICSDYIKKIQ